jgi:hypothetical protein
MFSPGFDDDDVSLAPDLLALSAQSSSSTASKIPEFVRPAVTVTNPVLPDSSWLTPPTSHKITSSSPVVGSAISPKVLRMQSAEKPRSPVSHSPALFADVLPQMTPQQQSAAPVSSPSASLFNVSGGNPAFTPMQPFLAESAAQKPSPASAAFTPVQSGHGSEFSPVQPGPVFGSPSQPQRKASAETPTKPQDWTAFADNLEVAASPQDSSASAASSVVVAPEESAVDASFEEERAEGPASFGGYGLLSPIREETDEYALTSREQEIPSTPARVSAVAVVPTVESSPLPEAVSAPQVSAPVSSIASPGAGGAAESIKSLFAPAGNASFALVSPAPPSQQNAEPVVESVVFVTPVKSSPVRPVVASAVVSATPAAVSVVSPLSSPAEVAVTATTAMVSVVSPLSSPAEVVKASTPAASSLPAPIVQTAVSTELSELDRIKQKIRVWDVASPSKSTAARAPTPEKVVPKYTESDLAEARQRADEAAAEANAKLRSEYTELQKKYEAEKALNQQMKDIVDEFEASIRVLVDGHKAAMQTERAALAKLQSEHLKLLEIAEDHAKKLEALNQEKEQSAKELAAAKAASIAAEDTVVKLTAQLEASTNKFAIFFFFFFFCCCCFLFFKNACSGIRR